MAPSHGITRRGFLAGTAFGLAAGAPLAWLAGRHLPRFTGRSEEVLQPEYAMPGRFPGRVVRVHNPAAVKPLDSSLDGEAANMEVGLLLGLTGQLAPDALRSRLPALSEGSLAMLGMRDERLRRELNVASLADRGVLLHDHEETAADPAGRAREAVAHLPPQWWLHTDLDVLSQSELGAQRVPGDVDEEGGLTWPQLTETVVAALEAGGCRGWSLTIYDPDQDPDGTEARRIVQFVAEVAPALP